MSRTIRVSLIMAACLVCLSCSDSGSPDEEVNLPQQINAGGFFTFSLPADMTGSCGPGADTYIGRYESPSMICDFDFGPWAGDPDQDPFVQFHSHVEIISGKRVIIQFTYHPDYDSRMPYHAYAYFPDEPHPGYSILGFSAKGIDKSSWNVAHAIFRSIRFL